MKMLKKNILKKILNKRVYYQLFYNNVLIYKVGILNFFVKSLITFLNFHFLYEKINNSCIQCTFSVTAQASINIVAFINMYKLCFFQIWLKQKLFCLSGHSVKPCNSRAVHSTDRYSVATQYHNMVVCCTILCRKLVHQNYFVFR